MCNKLMLGAAIVAAAHQIFAADTGWKSTVGLNVALARGNSSSTSIGGTILTARKWDQNELSFGADGNYGTANGTRNTENYGGFGQYNQLLDEHWYVYGRGDARRDTIAFINYRVTLSPGVGYYFIKNKTTTLSGEAGPGWVLEQFNKRSAHAGSYSYFTVRLGEKFTHTFNEHVSLSQYAEYQPKIDDFGDYVIEAGATLSAKIVGNLASTWTVRDTYRSEPAGRFKNDVQFLAGLSYSF